MPCQQKRGLTEMGSIYRAKYKYKGVEQQTATWYIGFADANGKWVRRRGGVTKEQAKDALKKAEMEVLNEKNNLPTERIGDISLDELLRGYLDARRQRTRKDFPEQANADLKRVFTFCRIHSLKNLTPAAVEKYIAHVLDDGRAAATANRILTRLKAFLNWAVKARRIPYNPIACVERTQGQKRHVRRAMSDDELSRLFEAALDGPSRRGLRRYENRPRKDGSYKEADVPLNVLAQWVQEGHNNVLAYRLMVEVGLRRNEARSVMWTDIDLDAGTLTTRPHWEGNKNGKEEVLPIAPGLHKTLCEWRRARPGPDDSAVVTITDRLLRCFDDDLVAAGLAKRVIVEKNGKKTVRIEKRDSSGRVLDLHALRHTFGTRLGRMPGIDPKSVQTLMRHSDPRMTFGIYVHSDKARLQAAVALLPAIELRNNNDTESPIAMIG